MCEASNYFIIRSYLGPFKRRSGVSFRQASLDSFQKTRNHNDMYLFMRQIVDYYSNQRRAREDDKQILSSKMQNVFSALVAREDLEEPA